MLGSIVDYKLCDRNFECSNCPFDKAMMNSSRALASGEQMDDSRIENIVQRLINDIGREELRRDYIYLNNHLMVKNLFANTYYLGFSPLANYLLDNCNSIEHCYNEDKIEKGQSLIKVNGDWGSLDVTSPISFSSLGKITNQEIKSNAEKWFGLIEVPKEELTANSLSGENYMKDILGVTRELTQVKLHYADVGETMMDGGIEVKFLYQVIGKEKYLNILKTLFYKSIKGSQL